MEALMTAHKTLKRQIRARMSKTGESYTAARRHFRVAKDSSMKNQDFENPRTLVAHELQPDLWPEWVDQHPWLRTFLTRAEAEARNRGDTECDHFHVQLAFLRLPSPVPDWFIQLKVNAEQWKEDILVTLGVNTTHLSQRQAFDMHLGYGSRINKARNSPDPVRDVPLSAVTDEAKGMLDLAKSEAELDATSIDERHFMVPMMDWHPYGEPPLDELRQLTGRPARGSAGPGPGSGRDRRGRHAHR